MSLKNSVKSILLRTQALRLIRQRYPRSVAILMYHSVSHDRDGQADSISPGITTPAELFRDQMQLLRQSYSPVTLDDVALWLQGNAELPPNAVAVTFDDGFADNYHIAAPIMEEFGIRGAIYLTVDSVLRQRLPWFCQVRRFFYSTPVIQQEIKDPESGKVWNLAEPDQHRRAFSECNRFCAVMSFEKREQYLQALEINFGRSLATNENNGPCMMTFEQARELRQRGHLIGNHTFSHGNLAYVPEQALSQELVQSHEILTQKLGAAPTHFSYPHPALSPQWNDRTVALTRQLGYKTAVLTQEGTAHRDSDAMLLSRVNVVAEGDTEALQWKLETAFIPKPFRNP